MMTDPATSDLAEVFHAETEFEAHTRAATLHEEGIDAMVIAAAPNWTGQVAISESARGAGVWVRREDETQAMAILQGAAEASVDLDWDDVDVGEREDSLPLSSTNLPPLPARIAFAVIAFMVMLVLLTGLMSLLW